MLMLKTIERKIMEIATFCLKKYVDFLFWTGLRIFYFIIAFLFFSAGYVYSLGLTISTNELLPVVLIMIILGIIFQWLLHRIIYKKKRGCLNEKGLPE